MPAATGLPEARDEQGFSVWMHNRCVEIVETAPGRWQLRDVATNDIINDRGGKNEYGADSPELAREYAESLGYDVDLNRQSASRPSSPGSSDSAAAASLRSHSGRPGWPGPRPAGNEAAVNAQAQALVNVVLDNPNSTFETRPHPRPEWGGAVTDVFRPDGLGVRFDANGQFVGFITQ